MEKQTHEEYRDDLAKDLKNIPDHKERAHALDLEKLSFRYDKAREAHLKDVAEHIQDFDNKRKEAEQFERVNYSKLTNERDLKGSWGSPFNRDLLVKMAELWLEANKPEKAESYYLQAGPYEYESAAENFEKMGDRERARKFWALRGENPTGYSEDRAFNSAYAWDKSGNIPKAIKAWENAIRNIKYYDEGDYNDLHGDRKVASGDVEKIEKRIEELKKMLEDEAK